MSRYLSLKTAPAAEPLTTAEAKTHLRVDGSDEDTYIASLVAAARETCEKLTGRSFVNTTWNLWLDNWPGSGIITIPRPPLSTITSVTYYDTADAATVFASSNYLVDTAAYPGRIILNSGATWPTTSLRPAKAIDVEFVAGYGSASSNMRKADIAMVRLMLSHLYENREPAVVGTIVTEIPMSLKQLIWQDRVTGAL